ncbi:MAG: hypothetical protein AAF591_05670 [Verrucomicrobiota bacterium]
MQLQQQRITTSAEKKPSPKSNNASATNSPRLQSPPQAAHQISPYSWGIAAIGALLFIGALIIAFSTSNAKQSGDNPLVKSDITDEDIARAHKILALSEQREAEAKHDAIARKLSERNVKTWPLRPVTDSTETPAE